MTEADVTDGGWTAFMNSEALERYFRRSLAGTRSSGIDRQTPDAFLDRLPKEIEGIVTKAEVGRHRFSPYGERLVLKGRGRNPRVISVPTIRDRLVLHALKSYLHKHIPHSVSRALPNEHIRSIKSYLNPSGNESDLWVIRIDIKAFYDQICHEQLFELLKTQVPDERVLGLLRRAVRTPTVPLASTRGRGRGRNPVGVPQGLAISNALANTYLASFDQAMLSATRFYLRYVDDILIICEKHEVPVIVAEMNRELDRLGLAPNTEKSRSASLSSPFEYLGYAIKWPLISVRRSTVDRYLRGLAAIITTFKYRLRYGRFPAFLSPDVARLVLVEELNEKITGAISGARRYGWLFYFAELNDRTLLYSIDAFVRRLLAGLPQFRQKLPSGLKRLSRAHFEVLHNQTGGYILDYNAFSTIKQRLDFLLERGRIDPADAERLSTLEVNRIFESYRHSRLSSLERDVGFVS